jgi:hypothetical protein
MVGAQRNLTAQFWADPSMTDDAYIDAFVDLVESEKSTRLRFVAGPPARDGAPPQFET